MRYLLQRFLVSLLTVVVVAVLAFVVMEAAPGSFFDDLRVNPAISRETVDALRAQYGLTAPASVRLVRWVESVARGDFGFSLAYRSPVAPLLWPRVLNTLRLTGIALVFAWAIGLSVGLWTAARKGSFADRVSDFASSALLSMPDLLLALLLLLVAVRIGWFTTAGMTVPVATMVLGLVPLVLRHVRASAQDAFDTPAVMAARGHGIASSRLAWRYVLPLAANPLITLGGSTLGMLLSASLLVESMVGYPGLGPLLLDAVLARDAHVVLAATLVSTTVLVAANLLADIALVLVDPRMRPARSRA